jgi:predicted Zn-dependent peptidase
LPFLAPAQSLQDFEKKVTEFTLSNGLHFIIVERHDAPVVAFNSYADVGAVDDPGGKTGLAHMFEHMAFKGTAAIGSRNWPLEKEAMETIEKAYDALQNERNKGLHADKAKVKQLAARLQQTIEDADKYVVPNLYTRVIEENGGTGLNAQTSNDSTVFFYKLPSNRIELWFLLESQRFYAPVFREFYKERSVVREERRMSTESNPQGLLVEAFTASAFEAHPYHNPPVGWATDIENLRVGDALEFFKKYYVPSNLSVTIVGDIDPKEARRLAEKYFGVIPAGNNPPPVHTTEPIQSGERRVGVESTSQPIEIIGYKRPDQLSNDDTVLEVLAQILSSGRTGLIYKELVTDKKLALEAGADSSFPASKYPHLFLLYIVPNQDKSLDDCEKPLFDILERLKTQKVDDAALQRVKTKLRADLISKLDGNAELASQLNAYYEAYGDWRKLFTELDDIDKVTADDVMRAAKKYLIPETRTVARLTPARGEK